MLSPQTVAPKPAALPPAAPPAPMGSANAAGGPTFAQFLNTQASTMAPPAPASPAEPEAAAPAPQSATSAARRNPAPKPPGDAQSRATQATAKAAAKADAASVEDAKKSVDATPAEVGDHKDDDDTADAPQLKEFTQLLGMAPQAPAQPDASAVAAHGGDHRSHAKAAAAAASDDDTASHGTHRSRAVDAGARATDTAQAADAPRAKGPDLRADKAGGHAAATELLQSASTSTSATPGAHTAGADASAPSFAAVLAQALPPVATAPAGGTPAPAYAQVQAPLHSSAFAPEVGARVSLLAVDGVQQAELQLNPADMGPVTVQIAVDGAQAQVSFHAAHAQTRQALEQSLPDLAAALQGQGLTLSGGGVFQQPARDQGANSDDSTERGTAGGSNSRVGGAERVGTSMAAAPARRTVGLLDTFA